MTAHRPSPKPPTIHWIDPRESMPEPNTDVLVACDVRNEMDAEPRSVVCHALLTQDGEWLYAQHNYFSSGEEKTVDGVVIAWSPMAIGPALADQEQPMIRVAINSKPDVCALIQSIQKRGYYEQSDRDTAVKILTEIVNELGPDMTARQLAIRVVGMKRSQTLPGDVKFAVEALWWSIDDLYVLDHINQ